MKKEYIKNNWRKLDNNAKVFSMDDRHNTNMFRYSVILKQKIDPITLKEAVIKSLEIYKSFKVKLGSGLFWDYLEYNKKEPKVTQEDDIPCQHIKYKRNNNYLFKVTYYKNKINLDIFHVLTDGSGAKHFLKSIIHNYLSLKYNIEYKDENNITYQDQYLKNYDKNIKVKNGYQTAYQLPGKIHKNINDTYHYIIDLLKIKTVCKDLKVTITEYITAMYIFAIYKSMYKKNTKKEIKITVPADLRKVYNTDTLSNFFICTTINSRIKEKKLTTFKEILNQVHLAFQESFTTEKLKYYLARDVKVGTNIPIRIVPLPVKKTVMKLVFDIASKTSTSTLSNVGIVDIEPKFKKYIDNILILVMPCKKEKMKCSICSYDQKLNITINSKIDSKKFQTTFFKLLKEQITNIKLETNVIK